MLETVNRFGRTNIARRIGKLARASRRGRRRRGRESWKLMLGGAASAKLARGSLLGQAAGGEITLGQTTAGAGAGVQDGLAAGLLVVRGGLRVRGCLHLVDA